MRPLITAIAVAALVLSAPATTSAGAPPDSSMPAGDPCGPPTASDPSTSTVAELPAWQTLEIVDTDGVSFTLADCIGTPVLVELFATWCSNCRRQLPKTQEAAVTMGDRAAVIALSVETDLSPDAVTEYAEQNDFPDIRFAVMSPDLLAAFVDAFGNSAANPPSTPKIVIDAQGRAGELTTGQESTDELVEQLTAAAAPGDTATAAG
jgi:cytochrome oxidase Cu insertion factor (SCO1/SenC/PrrC family)